MARPVIALLTDFGLRDHYVAAMKAVALGIAPDVTFVDISHDIDAHDVLAGALELDACYRDFPAGTIFLAVIDPGVGSSRRAIALDTGTYRFVGPDNGVFARIAEASAPTRIVELTEPRYARAAVSRTFEGRDRFAPAAAWLATGVDVAAFGPLLTAICPLEIPEPRVEDDAIVGEVLRVDRFGNLVTNIDRLSVERIPRGRVETDRHAIGMVTATYADVPSGALCAIIGGSGHLEIAINGGRAADVLGLCRGGIVRVRRGA
jgi:S-adenosyl-L-methionine hydrolase (adenosine-forming)